MPWEARFVCRIPDAGNQTSVGLRAGCKPCGTVGQLGYVPANCWSPIDVLQCTVCTEAKPLLFKPPPPPTSESQSLLPRSRHAPPACLAGVYFQCCTRWCVFLTRPAVTTIEVLRSASVHIAIAIHHPAHRELLGIFSKRVVSIIFCCLCIELANCYCWYLVVAVLYLALSAGRTWKVRPPAPSLSTPKRKESTTRERTVSSTQHVSDCIGPRHENTIRGKTFASERNHPNEDPYRLATEPLPSSLCSIRSIDRPTTIRRDATRTTRLLSHVMMDDKTLEDALVLTVHEIFDGSREELSVNNVRKQCESKHGLEEGFFGSAEWKLKSKTIIKGRVVSPLCPSPASRFVLSGLARGRW